jgi:hypothetical protein
MPKYLGKDSAYKENRTYHVICHPDDYVHCLAEFPTHWVIKQNSTTELGEAWIFETKPSGDWSFAQV